MAEPGIASLDLPRGVIKIVARPVAVIIFSLLIMRIGAPFHGDVDLPEATGHLEAAGRFKMLAAWLLLLAMTVACLAYLVGTLRIFTPDSVKRLKIAYFSFAFLGVALVLGGGVHGAPRYLGEQAICHALAGTWEPGNLRSWLDVTPACAGDGFATLWWLNEVQKFGQVVLMPALVLGTISCLAMPKRRTRGACQLQARRLNTHLYLAAALLVAGLLFLSALLRWPASGLAGGAASAYTAHVDAYIFYLGVTYSVFIASYYVPVAIKLTKLCATPPKKPKAAKARDGDEGGDEDDDSPVADLFNLFKTVAALFAPVIAGLLGSVLNF